MVSYNSFSLKLVITARDVDKNGMSLVDWADSNISFFVFDGKDKLFGTVVVIWTVPHTYGNYVEYSVHASLPT